MPRSGKKKIGGKLSAAETKPPIVSAKSSAHALTEHDEHVEFVPVKPEAVEGEAQSELIEAANEIEVLPADFSEIEEGDKVEIPAEVTEAPAVSGRDIVPYDPLEAYLREIRSYPRLNREEELALAERYHHNKDLEAAYRLVTSNLWLVVKIARDYQRAARSALDLIQEGNIGLMEAVKNFDPYRGVRFPSYAVWWIRAYMVRFLIANWRLVKIGTTQAQRKLFFNLKKEKEKLEREGFYPSPALLAEKLQVKESEVIEMEQRLGASDVSVDAPIQQAANEGEANWLSVLPSEARNPEEILEDRRNQQFIAASLKDFSGTLNPKEYIIFQERMIGEDKATLQDIAEKLGISRERVRQIENRLKSKLRDFLAARLGKEIEEFEL